jgi:hypothetical protein
MQVVGTTEGRLPNLRDLSIRNPAGIYTVMTLEGRKFSRSGSLEVGARGIGGYEYHVDLTLTVSTE